MAERERERVCNKLTLGNVKGKLIVTAHPREDGIFNPIRLISKTLLRQYQFTMILVYRQEQIDGVGVESGRVYR